MTATKSICAGRCEHGHRIIENPELEGTYRSHRNPTPASEQGNPKNHIVRLRPLSKRVLNSGRLGAVTASSVAELDVQILRGAGEDTPHSTSPRPGVRISPGRHRDTLCPGTALCPRGPARAAHGGVAFRPCHSKALSGTEVSPLGKQRLARSERGKRSPG